MTPSLAEIRNAEIITQYGTKDSYEWTKTRIQLAISEMHEKYGSEYYPEGFECNQRWVDNFLKGWEEIVKMFMATETRVQTGCFFYLYFWSTGTPWGPATFYLPQFLTDNENLSEEIYEDLSLLYESGGNFIRNPKKEIEWRCTSQNIELEKISTFVKNILHHLDQQTS